MSQHLNSESSCSKPCGSVKYRVGQICTSCNFTQQYYEAVEENKRRRLQRNMP
jgi:hypothetical protein